MGVRGNGQRIFILVIVGVFLLSSIAFSGIALFGNNNNQSTENAEVQKQLQDQIKQQQEQQAQTTPKEGALEGTKLAGFTPVPTVTSLQIIDIAEGTGEVVPAGATVTAHYTGALAKDGTIFQSSLDMGQPIPFSLSGVIKGWTDGVPGMKVGGKRRLVIPAEQAYGAQSPSPNIPANSDLVFDIEVVKLGE